MPVINDGSKFNFCILPILENNPCSLKSADCKNLESTFLAPPPYLLHLGVLPPVGVSGLFYVVLVVAVMGWIRPLFLEVAHLVVETELEEKMMAGMKVNRRPRSISLMEPRVDFKEEELIGSKADRQNNNAVTQTKLANFSRKMRLLRKRHQRRWRKINTLSVVYP